MKKEYSLIDAAVLLLQTEKRPYDLYQLFDILTAEKDFSEEEKSDIITKFYTDLTTSAKFVYTGDNQWDLKANQKIELWEKDGSFYKEYTKVDIPEEFIEPKVVKPVVKEEVVAVKEPVVEEPVVEAKVEAVIEPVVEEPKPTDKPSESAVETYEEEVFEDFEDFDEDKYNEYMDTYEDQYDD